MLCPDHDVNLAVLHQVVHLEPETAGSHEVVGIEECDQVAAGRRERRITRRRRAPIVAVPDFSRAAAC